MERRIEVRLDGMEQEVEWTAYGCAECGVEAGTVTADPSLVDVLREAEARGLDPSRPFRMLPHLPFGYVEFWQVPSPVPNAGLREREPVAAEAAP